MTHAVPFEILVATMFRSDFTFLEAMFPEASCWDYHILIVNQTDAEHQLTSNHSNVRVINTEERGLSRSRNMALENARGDICLIADDDVRYVKDVAAIVVSAFLACEQEGAKTAVSSLDYTKSASVFTFQMTNDSGEFYKNYPNIQKHTKESIQNVSSVEIAINKVLIDDLRIRFDINFGLGSKFPTAEEYIFLREVLDQEGICLFKDEVILCHPQISSGQFSGRDDVIFGRAALRYKLMGNLAYLSMIKYAWFYYRKGEIALKEIPSKIKVAFAGIKKYRNLESLK